MNHSYLLSAVLFLGCLGAGDARAQCPTSFINAGGSDCGGSPCYVETWVDDCIGDDDVAPLGAPFQTIEAAINHLHFNFPLSPTFPGLVHVNPGIYDNEAFPISMRPYVSVQGTGAKQCVVRLASSQPSSVFLPINDNPFGQGPGTCGEYRSFDPADPSRPIGVLFEMSLLGTGYSEAIDGFTLQGGFVQVYAIHEAAMKATISNCVFDQLDYSQAGPAVQPGEGGGVVGPDFGILMVHLYDAGAQKYHDLELSILNNTFIQDWHVADFVCGKSGGSAIVTAREDCQAIVSTNDPLCYALPGSQDPMGGALRSVGRSNIQNNLIWVDHSDNTPLMGIDSTDTNAMVTNPTTGVSEATATNIFDDELLGDSSLNDKYTVQMQGLLLPATVDASYDSPAFIGELLIRTGYPTTVGRDWRVLPSSLVVDRGASPEGGVLAAENGVFHVEPSTALGCEFLALDSFDFDGEGYGNPRIFGAGVDIGFDETSYMIDAGFGNDTIAKLTAPSSEPCVPGGSAGLSKHLLIFPSAGQVNLSGTYTPPPLGAAYTTMPGTLVPPATEDGVTSVPFPWGLLWIDSSALGYPSSGGTVNQPIPPGTITLKGPVTYQQKTRYGQCPTPIHPFYYHDQGGLTGGPNYMNIQGLYDHDNNAATPSVFTNLQSSYD